MRLRNYIVHLSTPQEATCSHMHKNFSKKQRMYRDKKAKKKLRMSPNNSSGALLDMT